MIEQAIALARELHEGQYRKQLDVNGNRIAYIEHPLLAMRLVDESGSDEITLAAAVLHDVEEDAQEKNPQQRILALPYGSEIEAIVARCSHQSDKSLPWQQRMQSELDDIPLMPVKAFHVKVADETANLADVYGYYQRIGNEAFAIFQKKGETLEDSKERMMWFHRGCMHAFNRWFDAHQNEGSNIEMLVFQCERYISAIGDRLTINPDRTK